VTGEKAAYDAYEAKATPFDRRTGNSVKAFGKRNGLYGTVIADGVPTL